MYLRIYSLQSTGHRQGATRQGATRHTDSCLRIPLPASYQPTRPSIIELCMILILAKKQSKSGRPYQYRPNSGGLVDGAGRCAASQSALHYFTSRSNKSE